MRTRKQIIGTIKDLNYRNRKVEAGELSDMLKLYNVVDAARAVVDRYNRDQGGSLNSSVLVEDLEKAIDAAGIPNEN